MLCTNRRAPSRVGTELKRYNPRMPRRVLHAFVFIVGVLACTYVFVVLAFGTLSFVQWSRRGVPQRAFWIGLFTGAMLLPGIVIAGLSVWFLRSRRRGAADLKIGFDVLPPR